MKYNWREIAQAFMERDEAMQLDPECIEQQYSSLISTDNDAVIYRDGGFGNLQMGEHAELLIGTGWASCDGYYVEWYDGTEADFTAGLQIVAAMWKVAQDG